MSNAKKRNQSYLTSKSFIRFHTDMAKMLGRNNDAIFFQFLIDRESFFDPEDGWFYLTELTRENNTNISSYKQREIIKRLKEKGIIDFERKGSPPLSYFKINHEEYDSQLLSFLTIEPLETKQLIVKKLNKPNYKIISKKDITNKSFTKVKDCTVEKSTCDFEIDDFVFRRKLRKKLPKKNLLVESWNSYEQTKTHKNPETKVYKNSINLLNLLKSGKFGSKCPINGNLRIMLKKKNPSLLTTKWTDSMILEAFERASKLYLNDHKPSNKAVLPKDLPTLIYNPRTKNSYLLRSFLDEPDLITQKEEAKEDWMDWWIQSDITSDSKELKDILSDRLVQIKKYWEKLDTLPDEFLDDPFVKRLGGKSWWESKAKNINLMVDYKDFLLEERRDVEWSTTMIGPGKPHWRGNFMKYLADVHIGGDVNRSYLFVR